MIITTAASASMSPGFHYTSCQIIDMYLGGISVLEYEELIHVSSDGYYYVGELDEICSVIAKFIYLVYCAIRESYISYTLVPTCCERVGMMARELTEELH